MPSKESFRRPAEPKLDDYLNDLEAALRAQMVTTPPRRWRFPSFNRTIRAIARPALHGSMAVVMVAVVILSGRGAPTYTDPTLDQAVTMASSPIWAEVKEIADPQPQRSQLIVNRRPPRFVTLVPTEIEPWIPLPEVNSPVTI